ncbi:chemotaxis protein methyltransferase [archaeon BMS3Abin16]|nr:chemotaxis protein methyltransferase [archaeon BMS3Abin16]HDY74688.1 protein-glutamate O-methyltransferase CheR [Euryarchaeota archaeon]
MKTEEINPALKELIKNIYLILGFNAGHYEIKHFKRRIDARMRATKKESYTEYLKYLKESSSEKDKLKKCLTVNVTEFFRNPEVYEEFRKTVVPSLIRRKPPLKNETIRVWSMGCSSGQEPYSIAMTLADALGGNPGKKRLIIYATDIDAEALSTAKKGVYKDITGIPEKLIRRYLSKSPNESFKIKAELQNLISFTRHDIFSDPPLTNMDALFCRNTMIYFNKEAKKDLYRLFNKSLAVGGYLIMGKAESFLNHRDYGFHVVSGRNHIFKKTEEMIS